MRFCWRRFTAAYTHVRGMPIHLLVKQLSLSHLQFAAYFERKPPLIANEWSEILGKLFSRLYFRYLHAKPKERRVVICEHMLTPKAMREAIAYVLFKQMKVPSIYYAPCELLALYTTGFADTLCPCPTHDCPCVHACRCDHR